MGFSFVDTQLQRLLFDLSEQAVFLELDTPAADCNC